MANTFFSLLTLARLALAASPNLTLAAADLGAVPSNIPWPHRGWWPGWSGVQNLVVFGDSYTTTGFNITGEQPSRENPLGNPAFPGVTSSNGPNWIDFLTYTYNTTSIRSLNLAWGGATVDTDIIHGVFPTYSLKQQIQDWFLPTYTQLSSPFPWHAWDTLFIIFLGVNDINYGYQYPNAGADAFAATMVEYSALVDELYRNGARNFLFMDAPAIDHAPEVVVHSASAPALVRSIITDWNANVSRIARNLSTTYFDATTFVFDTNTLYHDIFKNPDSHLETAVLKNSTGYCLFYGFGTGDDWYKKDSHCEYSVDEYFWLNALHPGFRVQNATAASVVKQLSAQQPWI